LRSAGTFCTGQPVHDAYLESLAELGIPGLLLFLGILGTTGFSLVRTARLASREGDAFIASAAVALAVGLAALAVASFALSTETSRETWMIVGLSLALPGMLRMSRSISKGEE
jgi:O-antigen ligase